MWVVAGKQVRCEQGLVRTVLLQQRQHLALGVPVHEQHVQVWKSLGWAARVSVVPSSPRDELQAGRRPLCGWMFSLRKLAFSRGFGRSGPLPVALGAPKSGVGEGGFECAPGSL